jgi:hypothetical protein
LRQLLIDSAEELKIPTPRFRPLSDEDGLTLCARIEATFRGTVFLRWWGVEGENQRTVVSVHFPEGDAWQHLHRVVDDADESVWLIAQNWMSDVPRCVVFESTTATIERILGNTHAFEYLICDRHENWLLAEDHHDVLTAVGDPVAANLSRINPLASDS